MKPLGEKLPYLVRRLLGPFALAVTAVALVLLLSTLGVPTSDARNRDWGALAIGIAIALVVTRLLDYVFFDVAFRLRRNVAAPALLRQLVSLLVFGVALQDTRGNLFSGLALRREKTVQVGDMVRSGEIFGTVEEMSWRAFKLRTMEGNVLLIPNSVASRERLEVFPRPGRPIARMLEVGLEYEQPPAKAREALEAAARDLPGIAAFPEPTAYLKKFHDFAVT